ncbi:hypothetical protein CFIO01_05768 [Colletotrichum fioriniae PJ7]|uniref:Uncharacterized protein n=1 Tax=Colletotrichum fioriniae PJ7 TaxID=1445577 RepID=A0A010S349_9PEZI|nr:hypothetical protein CFIO01_05768 [Colletotrichum fioriniae PJ7]
MIAIRDNHRQRPLPGSSKICKLRTPPMPSLLFLFLETSPALHLASSESSPFLAWPRLASHYRTSPYLTAVPELYPVLTQMRQARNISVWCVLQTWDEARLATNFEYHLLFRHYRIIHSQIRHANIVLVVVVGPPILCNLPEPLPL